MALSGAVYNAQLGHLALIDQGLPGQKSQLVIYRQRGEVPELVKTVPVTYAISAEMIDREEIPGLPSYTSEAVSAFFGH